jgi:hypothetical protein
MSDGQRGLEQFMGAVLREFQIANAACSNDATRHFITKKFRAGYSIDATARDLRAELHAQLIASAAQTQAEAESLV